MSICQSLFAIDPLLDIDPLLTIVGLIVLFYAWLWFLVWEEERRGNAIDMDHQ